MSTCTIAVFQGPGWPFQLEERPIPGHLGPGEVLVAVRMATVCGSDLHTADGRRKEPSPAVLGHEGVGEVVAVGSGRSDCSPGQRITWTLADSCGSCAACTDWDIPQKCQSLFKYGHAALTDGSGLNGCYASHIVLRPGTAVVPVPSDLPDAWVAPANCAMATMMAATEELPRRCHVAVIQGAGLLGLFGAIVLRARGLRRVVVVDVDPRRLALAAEFGLEVAAGSAAGQISSATADVVIEVTGNSSVVSEGVTLLRPGGSYIWVGMVHPQTRLELTGEAVIRRCLRIRGVHNYAPRHLRDAVDFLHTYRAAHPWQKLVSPPFPLKELNQAFQAARTGEWSRVAVTPLPV